MYVCITCQLYIFVWYFTFISDTAIAGVILTQSDYNGFYVLNNTCIGRSYTFTPDFKYLPQRVIGIDGTRYVNLPQQSESP